MMMETSLPDVPRLENYENTLLEELSKALKQRDMEIAELKKEIISLNEKINSLNEKISFLFGENERYKITIEELKEKEKRCHCKAPSPTEELDPGK